MQDVQIIDDLGAAISHVEAGELSAALLLLRKVLPALEGLDQGPRQASKEDRLTEALLPFAWAGLAAIKANEAGRLAQQANPEAFMRLFPGIAFAEHQAKSKTSLANFYDAVRALPKELLGEYDAEAVALFYRRHSEGGES